MEFPRLSPAGGERAIAMLMPAFAMLIAVVVGLPTPPQPATPRNATIAAAAVFRIEVHAVSPFYLRPWEKSAQQRRLQQIRSDVESDLTRQMQPQGGPQLLSPSQMPRPHQDMQLQMNQFPPTPPGGVKAAQRPRRVCLGL